jgi:hypothetical protein
LEKGHIRRVTPYTLDDTIFILNPKFKCLLDKNADKIGWKDRRTTSF